MGGILVLNAVWMLSTNALQCGLSTQIRSPRESSIYTCQDRGRYLGHRQITSACLRCVALGSGKKLDKCFPKPASYPERGSQEDLPSGLCRRQDAQGHQTATL